MSTYAINYFSHSTTNICNQLFPMYDFHSSQIYQTNTLIGHTIDMMKSSLLNLKYIKINNPSFFESFIHLNAAVNNQIS